MPAASPHPHFALAPFRHTVRVDGKDTDAGCLVFYANHLKFFERARPEWLDDELAITVRLHERFRSK